jgi:hypothetical protein
MYMGGWANDRLNITPPPEVPLRDEHELLAQLLRNPKWRQDLVRQARHIRGDTSKIIWLHHPFLLFPFPLQCSTTDDELVAMIQHQLALTPDPHQSKL